MPRNKTKERKIGSTTEENMRQALEAVEKGMSIRKAAKETEIPYPTLRRYVKRRESQGNISLVPNYEVNRVFSLEQEDALLEYFKICALKFYGLTTKDCRQVAYEMARLNNIKMPDSWERNSIAGVEWLRCFRNRHPDISLRKPEPCSLARATSFNRENVKTFFDNLFNVLKRSDKFADGTRIYNLDETGTSTVQKPQKVIAPTGLSNVGKVTSGEKGTLVTTCIVSATGHAIPPAIVFPRKNYRDVMLYGAPPGTLGLAASSGWMNSNLFVDVIKHFIHHTNSTPENPSLLIMDNHESHLSIEVLDLAKNSGVTILTLPPHTSAKLQPLDVGLLSPFKTYYYAALESWMLRNPGKPVTIYQVAEFVGYAYPRAMTPLNIAAAFSKCGIFPFNRNIFSDEDFLPSSVTDRPEPNNTTDEPTSETTETPQRNEENQAGPSRIADVVADTEKSIDQPSQSTTKVIITPEVFRPPLKAGPRDEKRKRRNVRKSVIATDTPEKDAIASERANAKVKKETAKRQVFADSSNTKTKAALTKPNKRKRKSDSDTSESEEFISDSSSDDDWYEKPSDDDDLEILDGNFAPLSRNPKEDDFVLVHFPTKKLSVYYVAKVLQDIDENDDCFVSFLRLKEREKQKFTFPIEPDLANVKISDIKYILKHPKVLGSKSRQETFLFKDDLSLLNIR